MNEQGKRGGARTGAGRKPADPNLARVAVPVRLPRWLAEFVDAQDGTRADVIEAALIKAHRLTPPRKP